MTRPDLFVGCGDTPGYPCAPTSLAGTLISSSRRAKALSMCVTVARKHPYFRKSTPWSRSCAPASLASILIFRQCAPRRRPCASQSLASTLIFRESNSRPRTCAPASFAGIALFLQGAPRRRPCASQSLASTLIFRESAPRPRIVSSDAVICPDPFV